ncbi:hypothetical protein [Sphingomonas colocasiae]|uniref:Uncharacterized protein n=1 Tax=Sphingomonas colocasiae TaxID=1848973 RepID=A0ABS7Q0M2_9SPHN|nr:hypothetical protein [Sphingomonas colocasiae]MBY8823305.1 hypothetical protein [Sphingomonas colocasiae]MBY8826440.1 hypothetical protein [Sphingomonas colocasiae]
MTVAPDHLLETREMLLERAREAMSLAEAEPLANRARIHFAAAERWLRLAACKPRRAVMSQVEPEATRAGAMA